MAWKPRIRSEELAAYANGLGSAQRGYGAVADELERGRTAIHERRAVVDATYRSPAKPLLMDHYRAIIGDSGRVINATRRIANLLGQARAEAHQASQQLGGIEIVLRKLDAQLADRQREVDRVSWAAKVHVPVAHEQFSVVDQLRSEVRRAQGARDAVRRQRDAFRNDHDDRCKAAEARFGGLDGEIKAESKHIERTGTRLNAERREWSASPVHLQHKQLWKDSGLDRLVDAAAGGGVLSAEMIAYLRTPDGAAAGAMFADLYPEIAGNLNGLPAKLRDHANRIMLDRAIEASTGKERERLERAKRSLATAESRYGPTYLLKFDPNANPFDPNGDGRIIVSIGDPDTAKNIGVFVPGVGDHMANLNKDLAQTGQLKRSMDAQGGGPSAAIYYLDYNPPNGFDGDGLWKAANLADSANAASVAAHSATLIATIPGFLSGLAAQNQAARITVIGHSFGSHAVMEAALAAHLEADAIVLIGSPGVNGYPPMTHLREDGQVWVGAAITDRVIQGSPVLPYGHPSTVIGAKGFSVDGMWNDDPVGGSHCNYLGNIPSDSVAKQDPDWEWNVQGNGSSDNIAIIAAGKNPS